MSVRPFLHGPGTNQPHSMLGCGKTEQTPLSRSRSGQDRAGAGYVFVSQVEQCQKVGSCAVPNWSTEVVGGTCILLLFRRRKGKSNLQVLVFSKSQKMKLWAIHPFHLGTRAVMSMAPLRTVTQGWLGLPCPLWGFAISPTHDALKLAGATLQLPREATTLGCQNLLGFSPCGVSRVRKAKVIVPS